MIVKLVNLLKELTSLVGPSGYEYFVASFLKDHMSQKCKRVWRDPLGNVICQLNELGNKPRVAVFAHMDELGFIVRKIEDNGFLRVERLGGIPEKAIASTRVIVLTEDDKKIEGVIGVKSHHLTKIEERRVVTSVQDIYIDVGAETKEEVMKMGIKVGNPVVYGRQFFKIGNRIFSNSLDNRGGCAIILKALEDIDISKLKAEIYFIGSVQEEFSLRGVLPAIRSVKPDIAICLDIAIACDTPDLEAHTDVKLGGGPTINMYTFHGRGTLAGLIPSKELVKKIFEIANEERINLQRNVFFGGLTDSSFAQLELSGIPSIDLGFPARYTHSPLEVCDIRDLEALEKLLISILYRIDEDFLIQ